MLSVHCYGWSLGLIQLLLVTVECIRTLMMMLQSVHTASAHPVGTHVLYDVGYTQLVVSYIQVIPTRSCLAKFTQDTRSLQCRRHMTL